jgi:YihY family inner membrane protein
LTAFAGVFTAATVAGTAYSNDYGVSGTESSQAAHLLREGFPGADGDTDTVVWHTTDGTVRDADVAQTMTRTLDRLADLPGIASVTGPYENGRGGQISGDGRTAYATVTFDSPSQRISEGEARAFVDTAESAGTEGLRIALGGSAVSLTQSADGHLAEIVGVVVAAAVLLLAFGSPAAALLPIATALLGVPRIALARRVLDRFGAADGGLLAAGIAYNAVLALIPLGLLATGLAGALLSDPASRADLIRALATFLPPLAGVVDEIVAGLTRASPSVSIVGLVLAAWGTSRLFASLEAAIALMDATVPRRSLIRRTARRVGSVIVLALIVLVTLVAAPTLAIAVELSDSGGSVRPILDVLLALLPPVLGGLALAVVYRVVPPTRPTWRAIALPAVVGAVALVVVTRVFVFVAPRIFGANLVYGTLGAILVGLTWLDLAFTVVLLGAAWVRERAVTVSEAAVA